MKRAILRFVASLEEGDRYKIFIAVVVAICIVAICIGIYVDKYYKYAEIDPLMLGIRRGNTKTAEEITALKSKFNDLFTDELKEYRDVEEGVTYKTKNPSIDSMVYNAYDLKNVSDFYSVDSNIPQLNIDAPNAEKINREIKEEYYEKAYVMMRKTEGMTIYSLKYAAFVNNAYLSLVIKTTYKEEGDKPEKVTIKTYNYNIATDSIVTIDDLIELKGETKNDVQSKITKEIQTSDANSKILAKEYGNLLYTRDLNNEMYKVENTENFFLTQDGYVYIVYAYGNTEDTNEMDIVIF